MKINIKYKILKTKMRFKNKNLITMNINNLVTNKILIKNNYLIIILIKINIKNNYLILHQIIRKKIQLKIKFNCLKKIYKIIF